MDCVEANCDLTAVRKNGPIEYCLFLQGAPGLLGDPGEAGDPGEPVSEYNQS